MTFLGSKGDLLAQLNDEDEDGGSFSYYAFPRIKTLAQITEEEVCVNVQD